MASQQQPSLPAKRSFIVQLHADANVAQGEWQGRVEHLVSFQTAHFRTLEELLTFMVEILNAHDPSAESEDKEVTPERRLREDLPLE